MTKIMNGQQPGSEAEKPVRVSNNFTFVVQAPLDVAAPLFGPEGERCWAGPHWDPQFVYPQPAHDEQGAVFTVNHGTHNSVWVNTLFDLAGGRMQYVTFIEGGLVSVIDVRLTSEGKTTRVGVTYTRTALTAAANDDVKAMGTRDARSGPDWEKSIAECLRGRR